MSQEAYRATLMKFHPWIVQKAALAAMNLLPTREGLIQKICFGDEVSEIDSKVARRLLLKVSNYRVLWFRCYTFGLY